jgi:hypothetical protein
MASAAIMPRELDLAFMALPVRGDIGRPTQRYEIC